MSGVIERLGKAIESLEDLKICDLEEEHFKINQCLDVLRESLNNMRDGEGNFIED